MKTTQSMEKAKIRAEVTDKASADISKISAAFIIISAGVIGCLATASLIAGTIISGGPLGLIQNYISAITG
jgi:hypothetical protein